MFATAASVHVLITKWQPLNPNGASSHCPRRQHGASRVPDSRPCLCSEAVNVCDSRKPSPVLHHPRGGGRPQPLTTTPVSKVLPPPKSLAQAGGRNSLGRKGDMPHPTPPNRKGLEGREMPRCPQGRPLCVVARGDWPASSGESGLDRFSTVSICDY